MFRNKSVNAHSFAMIPRADIPRSSFNMQKTYKTTFDEGFLIPFHVDEVLPGDTFNFSATIFARMATPLYPLMDNLHLDTFFFFVPCRLLWNNWVKFQGEQDNPGDSVSYVIPQQVSPATGYALNSLQDYMGLPTVGVPAITAAVSHNALPLRAYNLIYNEWFRPEDLVNSVTEDRGDGPDAIANYVLLRRAKRHDYITSALPWPLKGGISVSLPLGSSAPVKTSSSDQVTGVQAGMKFQDAVTGTYPGTTAFVRQSATTGIAIRDTTAAGAGGNALYPSNLYADLSAATAATINQIRQAFQIQRLLERDARGGTRYTEALRARFGVNPPDSRLQRPEYLGGTSVPVAVRSVPQTSGTAITGSATPLGQLGGVAQVVAKSGFTQSFTEHGYILGLASVRADLTYQQGLRKLWNRSTRYDFYEPVFGHLGEQAILNKEVYCDGSVNDAAVFGYQERWAEYRYAQSQITGLFRSTAAGTLDGWHLAQKFAALPTLNGTFIAENAPMDRVLAVTSQTGKHFYMDAFITNRAARPLPMYSVPGLIDHF